MKKQFFQKNSLKNRIIIHTLPIFIFVWLVVFLGIFCYSNYELQIKSKEQLTSDITYLKKSIMRHAQAHEDKIDIITTASIKLQNSREPNSKYNLAPFVNFWNILKKNNEITSINIFNKHGTSIFSNEHVKTKNLNKTLLTQIREKPITHHRISCKDVCYLLTIKPVLLQKNTSSFIQISETLRDIIKSHQNKAKTQILVINNTQNNILIDSYSSLIFYKKSKKHFIHDDNLLKEGNFKNYTFSSFSLFDNKDIFFMVFSDIVIHQKHFRTIIRNLISISIITLIIMLTTLFISLDRELIGLNNLAKIMPLIGKGSFISASSLISNQLNKNYSQELEIILKKTQEITHEIQDKQNQLKYIAEHDSLTGLPSRSTIKDIISKETKINDAQFSIISLDINYFKVVNDTYGHAIGDKLLISIAKSISQLKPGKGLASRIGGDEFVIFLRFRYFFEVENYLLKIKDSIKDISFPEVGLCNIDTSIGVAIYPKHSRSPEKLFILSDAAMYENKVFKQKIYHVYNGREILIEQEKKRSTISNIINLALKEDLIDIHFQPIFPIQGKQPICYEALARFNLNQDFNQYGTEEIISAAEKNYSIINLDKKIIDLTLKELSKFNIIPYININISNISILQDDFEKSFNLLIRKYKFPQDKITLEITESYEIKDIEKLRRVMKKLRKSGVKFALDDFGSGFSSFFYIKELLIDFIKIDKKIIRNSLIKRSDQGIIEAISLLAKRLDIKTIAEGVEDKKTIEFLHHYNIDFLQGHYLGKPAPDSIHLHQNELRMNPKPDTLPSHSYTVRKPILNRIS